MSAEYDVKVFKSGNSVAVRLPKALGLAAGTPLKLREENGCYSLEPVEKPKRKINVDKFWGKAKGLGLIKPEDRLFEERPIYTSDAGADPAT